MPSAIRSPKSQCWSGSVPLSPDLPLQRCDHTSCLEGTDALETSHCPRQQKPSGFSSCPDDGWALERRAAFLSAFQVVLTSMPIYQALIPACTVACKHAGWC